MTQYAVSAFIFEFPEFDLSLKAKAVISYLAFRSNKKNTCFPALKTIAQGCSLSLSSVKRAISELLGLNLIRKDKRFRDNGGQTSNLYTILADELPADRKHRKKMISPKLSNSTEDTTKTNTLINSNYTPYAQEKASESESISQSFSPCREDKESGSVTSDNAVQHRKDINHDEVFKSAEYNRENLANISMKRKGEGASRVQLKQIFLLLMKKLIDSFVSKEINMPIHMNIHRSNGSGNDISNSVKHQSRFFLNSDPPPGSH